MTKRIIPNHFAELDQQNLYNQWLRHTSGNEESRSVLVQLLYTLACDHLPIGTLARVLREAIFCARDTQYTNGYLAQWARQHAVLLERTREEGLEEILKVDDVVRAKRL